MLFVLNLQLLSIYSRICSTVPINEVSSALLKIMPFLNRNVLNLVANSSRLALPFTARNNSTILSLFWQKLTSSLLCSTVLTPSPITTPSTTTLPSAFLPTRSPVHSSPTLPSDFSLLIGDRLPQHLKPVKLPQPVKPVTPTKPVKLSQPSISNSQLYYYFRSKPADTWSELSPYSSESSNYWGDGLGCQLIVRFRVECMCSLWAGLTVGLKVLGGRQVEELLRVGWFYLRD